MWIISITMDILRLLLKLAMEGLRMIVNFFIFLYFAITAKGKKPEEKDNEEQ